MRRIAYEIRKVLLSVNESSRQKSNLIILAFAASLVIVGLILSASYNSLAVTLIYSGVVIGIVTYIHRWRDPLSFLVLTGFSIVGFPIFVILHNAFYAFGEISKNIFLLKSIFEILHAVFFIIAVAICPTGLFIGLIGLLLTLLLRWKNNDDVYYF